MKWKKKSGQRMMENELDAETEKNILNKLIQNNREGERDGSKRKVRMV